MSLVPKNIVRLRRCKVSFRFLHNRKQNCLHERNRRSSNWTVSAEGHSPEKVISPSDPMSSKYSYVIVGGGNAAGYAAQEYVKLDGPKDQLAIITDEPVGEQGPSPVFLLTPVISICSGGCI